MIYKRILIKEIEPKLFKSNATLRIYISERNEAVNLRPGMLVCPGGGYSFCSPREAEIIAFIQQKRIIQRLILIFWLRFLI